MSSLETDRANRKAARALFDQRLAQVKDDLAARSVGGRIIDRAKGDALALADDAVAVAKDNKGIIAATVAVLAAWIWRAPLLNWIGGILSQQSPVQRSSGSDDDQQSSQEHAE